MPKLTQRKHIAEAAKASLQDTGFGPILEHLQLRQTNGSKVEVSGVNFWGLLQQATLNPDSSYGRYVWKRIALQPPTPARLEARTIHKRDSAGQSLLCKPEEDLGVLRKLPGAGVPSAPARGSLALRRAATVQCSGQCGSWRLAVGDWYTARYIPAPGGIMSRLLCVLSFEATARYIPAPGGIMNRLLCVLSFEATASVFFRRNVVI